MKRPADRAEIRRGSTTASSHGIARLEAERLSLQAELDAQKTAIERNRLGQFATPTALAREILDFGRRLLGMGKKIHFLDPAMGTGSFYSALRAVAPASRIGRCVGYDVDPHYAEPAIRLWRDSPSPLDVRVADFTAAEPPAHERERVNLIICNPPYVRHHHITAAQKQRLQAAVSDRLGIRMSGLSGLYCYFLMLADAWLRPGGVAGWLIPSEWMDVNYGAQVKMYLGDRVRLTRIHRFDPSDAQFDDALVSSTVVWFRKAHPASTDDVEFSFGGSLGQPARIVSVTREAFRAARKWTQLCPRLDESASQRARGTGQGHDRRDDDAATLADIFSIKRGIATGANAFFVLSPDDIAARGLPMSHFRPILPSPRYLETDEIRALEDGNPDVGPDIGPDVGPDVGHISRAKRFLLSVSDHESVIREHHPRVWRYLQEGVAQGIHERYLCRHRQPWYTQEHRPPAPILCTYMGRKTNSSVRPFRFVLNHSKATAANVYLMLYPRPALARLIARDGRLLRTLWSALNELPIEVLLGEGRVYGGGLHKLEPRELANVPLLALGVDIADELACELAGPLTGPFDI